MLHISHILNDSKFILKPLLSSVKHMLQYIERRLLNDLASDTVYSETVLCSSLKQVTLKSTALQCYFLLI